MRREQKYTGAKLRRKNDSSKTHSLITITDASAITTEYELARTAGPGLASAKATLKAELTSAPHPDITAEQQARLILELRKKYAKYSGLSGMVKPATPLGENGSLPKKLAIKIFDIGGDLSPDEQKASAQAAVALYTELDQFATWFESNGKIYLAMEWYGDHDLFVEINRQLHKKLTAEQLILNFQKLLHKVDKLHKLTGKPINDIKPENMIPIFDDADQLVDIAIIDIESNQLSKTGPWTPQYQFEEDIAQTLNTGRTLMQPTIATDCHALATTLAMLSNYKTDSQELCTNPYVTRFHYPGSKTGYLDITHIVSTARGYRLDGKKNAASYAIAAIFNTLASGKLPVGVENTPQEVHVFYLQHDCKKLFAYFRQQYRSQRAANPALFSTTTESPDFTALKEKINHLIQQLNTEKITPEVFTHLKQALGKLITQLIIEKKLPSEYIAHHCHFDYAGSDETTEEKKLSPVSRFK
ncbi:MAG: hypothetical protein P1U63_09945 [Coxiellaceae bacterium]|nr:hypothetical protein [Coxiellaceae bacterium]